MDQSNNERVQAELVEMVKGCWAVDMRAARKAEQALARVEEALRRVERIEPEGSTEWRESGKAMRRTVVREIRAALDGDA